MFVLGMTAGAARGRRQEIEVDPMGKKDPHFRGILLCIVACIGLQQQLKTTHWRANETNNFKMVYPYNNSIVYSTVEMQSKSAENNDFFQIAEHNSDTHNIRTLTPL